MKAIVAVLFVTLGAASAGFYGASLVGPANPGAVIAGPSAKASIVGPDGSHNGGVAYGGVVHAAPIPGGVVNAAVSPGYVAHAAPVLAAPLVAPVAHGFGAVIAGPSGTVHASGHGGAGYAGGAFGLGAYGYGGGYDGGYVSDGSEHLYDDGSYRPEHHYGGHGY